MDGDTRATHVRDCVWGAYGIQVAAFSVVGWWFALRAAQGAVQAHDEVSFAVLFGGAVASVGASVAALWSQRMLRIAVGTILPIWLVLAGSFGGRGTAKVLSVFVVAGGAFVGWSAGQADPDEVGYCRSGPTHWLRAVHIALVSVGFCFLGAWGSMIWGYFFDISLK